MLAFLAGSSREMILRSLVERQLSSRKNLTSAVECADIFADVWPLVVLAVNSNSNWTNVTTSCILYNFIVDIANHINWNTYDNLLMEQYLALAFK